MPMSRKAVAPDVHDDPAVLELALVPGPLHGPLVVHKDIELRTVRTSDLDSGEFMPRSELIDRTGATPTEIRKIEFRGLIISRHRTVNGRRLYTKEHVDRVISILSQRRIREEPLPRRGRPPTRGYSQEQARIAFEMLRDGKAREDIFLALQNIHPLMFRAICEEYEKLAGAITISPRLLDQIHAMPIEGFELPLRSGEDVARLIEHLSKPRLCATCGEHSPAENCTRCVKAIQETEKRKLAKEGRRTAPSGSARAIAPPRGEVQKGGRRVVAQPSDDAED
jgi:hypothetical protein